MFYKYKYLIVVVKSVFMCKIIKESQIHITLDGHIIIKRSTLTHRNRKLQTDAFAEIREFKDNTI